MIRILAIGRQRNCPEAALYERYAMRVRPKPVLTELPEGRGAPAEVKRREGGTLLAALPEQAVAVALDPGGEAPDSERLAALMQRWLGLSRPICFLIGGAEGLDAQVIARADFVLSFGRLTWPHFLVRAMLAEQLYRAQAIAAGHPYHRSGR